MSRRSEMRSAVAVSNLNRPLDAAAISDGPLKESYEAARFELLRLQSSFRGFLLTGSPTMLRAYRDDIEHFRQKVRAASFKSAFGAWERVAEKVLRLRGDLGGGWLGARDLILHEEKLMKELSGKLEADFLQAKTAKAESDAALRSRLAQGSSRFEFSRAFWILALCLMAYGLLPTPGRRKQRGERSRLSAFAAHIPTALAAFDSRKRLVWANGSFYEMFQKESVECVGEGFEAFAAENPSFLSALRSAFERLAAGAPAPVVFEAGRPRRFQVSLFESAEGYGLWLQDVTQAKEVEATQLKKLAQEQQWLETMLDTLPVPLLLVEPGSGQILFSNQAADRLGGSEFLRDGCEYRREYRDEDGSLRPSAQLPHLKAARGEKVQGEFLEWSKNAESSGGESAAALFFSTLLPAMNGHPGLAMLAFQDVSRFRLSEKALKADIRRRDEFLSVAAHELKSPIASLFLQLQLLGRISGQFTQMADSRGGVPAQLDQLRITREGVLRLIRDCELQSRSLAKLVDQLLDMTRVREGRLELHAEEVNLTAVVEETLARFSSQVSQSGTQLRFTPSSEKLIGYWDRTRLDQVVTNLISNAIKYGRGSAVEVMLSCSTDRRSARLLVRDHGMGIAPEKQEKIFERFERVQTGERISGLGLGLYIVKQIVEAHSGTIQVESQLGEGSTFIVELPFLATRTLEIPRSAVALPPESLLMTPSAWERAWETRSPSSGGPDLSLPQ